MVSSTQSIALRPEVQTCRAGPGRGIINPACGEAATVTCLNGAGWTERRGGGGGGQSLLLLLRCRPKIGEHGDTKNRHTFRRLRFGPRQLFEQRLHMCLKNSDRTAVCCQHKQSGECARAPTQTGMQSHLSAYRNVFPRGKNPEQCTGGLLNPS